RIIVNGQLMKGKNGAAGEMHFKLYPDKRRKCTCGGWDCFEIYASGTALKLDAEEALNDKNVTTYDVIEGVNQGDEKMIAILDRWQNDLIIGIKGLTNLFDPDCVILSGSMAQFVDFKHVEDEVNSDIVTTPTSVRIATAGNYAGMIGAALLAMEGV
ncbi:ROK family protein, partial [bacterium]|nr:ROK family protein [bacterium]